MEFTDGNYYLVDILEIALLAEESGNVYQSYAKINYTVPKQAQLLTGITNRTIETHGVPFRNAMDGLVEFIRCDQTRTPAIIIAHEGNVLDGIKAFRKKHSNISRIYCYNITSDWLIYFQPIRFTEMIKNLTSVRRQFSQYLSIPVFKYYRVTCFPPCDWPFRNLTF